jgi:hypothetical protein
MSPRLPRRGSSRLPLSHGPLPRRSLSRRRFLRGLGGVAIGLPLLESVPGCLMPPEVAGPGDNEGPFAIFFRQPCGVAAAQDTDEIGDEPERFWPREIGPLTRENVEGRALDELDAWLDQLLVLGNINQKYYKDFRDAHANGAFSSLTARGPLAGTQAPLVEADGESIDNFLARHLSGPGSTSLYLHAGAIVGWLGGACISHREAGVRHVAERDPHQAFLRIMGDPERPDPQASGAQRRTSVNDLVRDQLDELLRSPRVSRADRLRLEDHFDAIRDVERRVVCQVDEDLARRVAEGSVLHDSPNGDALLQTVRLHMEVAALAVACGATRSVVIQVGDGNGGDLRFADPDTGALMENFHFISHRRTAHDDDGGSVIGGSDLLHHKVDRQFAQLFAHLLGQLASYRLPDGRTLLSSGVAAWYNDNANGPEHCLMDVPWILAGSAGGRLRQGEFIEAVPRDGTDRLCGRDAPRSLNKLHNTLATALGVRKSNGDVIDDFGDPNLERGLLDTLFVS